MSTNPQSWTSRVLAAVVTLVVVAVGARLAWDLLRPLLGAFIVLGAILAIIGLAIRRWSWR